MYTVNNIVSALESWAPITLAEGYDNVGLLTGQHDQSVHGVLVTLDCTEEIVEEAITTHKNLIIAHHPIVFSGLKKINGYTYVERAIIKAIKHDIAIYAIHTNLDNVITGVNKKIADKLSLSNLEILFSKNGMDHTIGSGILAELVNPMTPSDFLHYVKDMMNLKVLKHTSICKTSIKKIAICGGSGSFLTSKAIAKNADVFITADVKYHEFFDAEGKIILIDIGHFESEIYTVDLIIDHLLEKFPSLSVSGTKLSTNPVQYFI